MTYRAPDPARIEVIDDATAAMFRAMTAAERVAATAAARRTARRLVAAGVRNRYPNWTDEDVEREVVRRLSGGAT